MTRKVELQQMSSISTEELEGKIGNLDFQIIDVRPIEVYNGWKFNNEKRGGHIKGARSVPFKWLNYIDWIEIVRAKGIMPSNSLVIYGSDKFETEKVANQFIKAGYKDVRVFHNYITEWNVNNKLPIDRLKRYNKLVSANWLEKLIKTGSAPEYNNKKYVICHTHYQNRHAYEEGHIPEAIDLDTNLLESSVTWSRRSPQELKISLEKLGITYDTTVILYGRFSYPDINDPFPGSSAGHLGAFRCAFIMMYAGVKDVRILNGGLQSWIYEGFETTTKEYKKHPVKDFGKSIPSKPEIVVDIKEAKEILKASKKNLISVRSWREFIGEVSGYNYIEKKGRICIS